MLQLRATCLLFGFDFGPLIKEQSLKADSKVINSAFNARQIPNLANKRLLLLCACA